MTTHRSSFATTLSRGTMLLLALFGPLAHGAASLREVLSPEEFERAGLQKLTAEELEYLSERLLGVAKGDAAASASVLDRAEVKPAPVPTKPVETTAERARTDEDTFGRERQIQAAQEQQQAGTRELHSRIVGPFEGWSGRTVFHLENGQVWQQVEPSVFSVSLESPVVAIRRGRFGAFYLGVEGYGSQVKVRRIK